MSSGPEPDSATIIHDKSTVMEPSRLFSESSANAGQRGAVASVADSECRVEASVSTSKVGETAGQ